jgi:hypothetical protein
LKQIVEREPARYEVATELKDPTKLKIKWHFPLKILGELLVGILYIFAVI